jgi:hypothetical protein
MSRNKTICPETNTECAGEDQQQFTRGEMEKRVCENCYNVRRKALEMNDDTTGNKRNDEGIEEKIKSKCLKLGRKKH